MEMKEIRFYLKENQKETFVFIFAKGRHLQYQHMFKHDPTNYSIFSANICLR